MWTDRKTEGGCRAIISLFLNNAVQLAKGLGARHVALFAEVPVEHPNLPGVGPVSGALDFLVSSVRDKEDITMFGNSAIPESPKFVIIEAKSSSTLVDKSSYAQIWAQLLTVDYYEE